MKIEKTEKLAANLYEKTGYVIHTRSLKQALNHGLILEIKKKKNLKKNAWLKCSFWKNYGKCEKT